ncbi:hypothetical protein FOCC_FOCC017483 [Frankliniella occidentalis]|nr:hypothetical protein FOCC_FOCC017483 [Frankliniella occidentalis]
MKVVNVNARCGCCVCMRKLHPKWGGAGNFCTPSSSYPARSGLLGAAAGAQRAARARRAPPQGLQQRGRGEVRGGDHRPAHPGPQAVQDQVRGGPVDRATVRAKGRWRPLSPHTAELPAGERPQPRRAHLPQRHHPGNAPHRLPAGDVNFRGNIIWWKSCFSETILKRFVMQASQLLFPHDAVLQARCRELGMYKLRGAASLQCQNGKWSERVPHCVPTTVLTNFAPDSPPTILLRIPTGSASVEPGGELAVFPGSIVHLECLYSRKVGTPEWSWTATHRQYLTGWAIASDERDWKYRLSIYYSKPTDSGTYTCRTPAPEQATNSVTVRVAPVHCDPDRLASRDPALSVRSEGSRLGQTASFSCPTGYTIKGAATVTCTGSAHWSHPPPACVPIRCPALVLSDPRMRLVELNNSYGGHAIFACTFGYTLDPRPGLMCESTGQWDRPLPRCKREYNARRTGWSTDPYTLYCMSACGRVAYSHGAIRRRGERL